VKGICSASKNNLPVTNRSSSMRSIGFPCQRFAHAAIQNRSTTLQLRAPSFISVPSLGSLIQSLAIPNGVTVGEVSNRLRAESLDDYPNPLPQTISIRLQMKKLLSMTEESKTFTAGRFICQFPISADSAGSEYSRD